MNRMFAGLAIVVVWSALALAQAPAFPPSDTGDHEREYSIRTRLTDGDSHGLMGGMLSCKQLRGPYRQVIEKQFTSDGKALCHRLSKLKGLVDIKVHDYTVQVMKAKAFQWEELDAVLQESFTSLDKGA